MNNEIKIQNIKTGVVKTVKQNIASDYIGTGDFKLYVEKTHIEEQPKEDILEKYKKNLVAKEK